MLGLLTYEATRSVDAGVTASLIMAILPCHLMRSRLGTGGGVVAVDFRRDWLRLGGSMGTLAGCLSGAVFVLVALSLLTLGVELATPRA